jgi:MFS family permease
MLLISTKEQLGLAMTGMTIGLLLGAPVGGALYGAFGFRGPFIFGIIITFLDLVGRLLIIERKDALKYGYDPTASAVKSSDEEADAPEAKPANEKGKRETTSPSDPTESDENSTANVVPTTAGAPAVAPEQIVAEQGEAHGKLQDTPPQRPKNALLHAIIRLGKSPRAMTAYLNTLIIGCAFIYQQGARETNMGLQE